MNTFRFWLVVAMIHSVVAYGHASEPTWIGDLAVAKKTAAEQDSDLFILLTGSGYCLHCDILKAEVLGKEEFADWVSPRFTLAKPESDPEEYLSPAVPTVVLAESDGQPYGYLTGFASGTSVAKYREQLEVLIKRREKRDAVLAEASKLTGTQRAETLDRALSIIEPSLGTFQQRGNDPLLAFYGPVVEEVIQLAGPTHALTKKYQERKADLERKLSANDALNNQLIGLSKEGDQDAILRFADEKLKEDIDDETRFRMEFLRQRALEDKEQFAAALSNARRMLKSGLTGRNRRAFLDREMYDLFRLDRIDEMLAQLNRRIDDAKNDIGTRRRLLLIRSSQMQEQDPPSRNVKLDREFLSELEPESPLWGAASLFLASSLKRDRQYDQALEVLSGITAKGSEVPVLAESAECRIEMGELEAASELISQAAIELEAFSTKKDPRSKAMVARGTQLIAELKQRLESASAKESSVKETAGSNK